MKTECVKAASAAFAVSASATVSGSTAASAADVFGVLGGRTAPGAYAHAFQYSLGIDALLMFACIGLSSLLVRHQRAVLRRRAA